MFLKVKILIFGLVFRENFKIRVNKSSEDRVRTKNRSLNFE